MAAAAVAAVRQPSPGVSVGRQPTTVEVVGSFRRPRWVGALDLIIPALSVFGPVVTAAWSSVGDRFEPGAHLLCGATMVTAFALTRIDAARWSLASLRLPAIFYVSYSLLILLPTASTYEAASFLHRDRYLLAVPVGFLLVVLGVVLVPSRSRAPEFRVRGAAGGNGRPRSADGLVVLALLGVCALVVAVFVALVPQLPILSLLGGSGDVAGARQAAGANLSIRPVATAASTVRLLLLPFVSAYSVARWVRSRTPFWLWLSILSVSLGVFFAILTTEKSLVGQLLIPVLVATFVAGSGRIRAGRAVVLLLALLAFPLLVFALLSSGRGDAKSPAFVAAESLSRRVFWAPSFVLSKHFEFVPDATQGFYRGASLPVVGRAVSGTRAEVDADIYQLTYASHPQKLAGGKANAAYVGGLWADFGWPGVVAGSFLTGAALGLIDRWVSWRPSPAMAALWGLFAMKTVFLTSSSVFGTVLSYLPGMLEVSLLALLLRSLSDEGSFA